MSITLAAVLKDDVDWKALPADLPPSVTARACDGAWRRTRSGDLSAIGDARLELEDAASCDGRHVESRVGTGAPRQSLLPWAVALVAVTAAVAAFAVWGPWRPSRQVAPVRVSGEVGADITLAVGEGASAVLSRDGQTVVFVGVTAQSRPALYVRPLSQLQATLLPRHRGGPLSVLLP